MGSEARQFDAEDMAALEAIHQGMLDGTLVEVVRGLAQRNEDEDKIIDTDNGTAIECEAITGE